VRVMRLLNVLLVLGVGLLPLNLRAQQPLTAPNLSHPTVTPAIDGIFAVFQTRPLVGMGDWHGLAQDEDFYVDLVREPRFRKNSAMSSSNLAVPLNKGRLIGIPAGKKSPTSNYAEYGPTRLVGFRRSLGWGT
jgi:hypothetical protein